MIKIDGSIGEGGGQVLRSALTLSVMTRKALRIDSIRGKRKKPGLRPQHLKAVQATAEICGADYDGGSLGSKNLTFIPGDIVAGDYHFDIGTAGSTSLVLQTLLLPLSHANTRSTIEIKGGTHVPWSPCYHYIDINYLPYLWHVGLDVHVRMEMAGFYPGGGGQIRAVIEPMKELKPLNLLERGRLLEIRGISAVANLARNIATRQRRQVIGRLGRRFPLNDIRISELHGPTAGSLILLLAEFEHSHVCYFALGQKGKSADKVADEAIEDFEAFYASTGVIDQYMADQLLLPLAFADAPSHYSTSQITKHLITNAEIIKSFLPVEIEIKGNLGKSGFISIYP